MLSQQSVCDYILKQFKLEVMVCSVIDHDMTPFHFQIAQKNEAKASLGSSANT